MTEKSDITARTRVLAILGDPVAQSGSPTIHNAAMHACSLDGVYTALRCTAADFVPLFRALARAGGGGNVTKPYKQAAAASLDRATERVQQTGACNTFWSEGANIVGDNTDVDGFLAALHNHVGSAAGQRVLLIGAGGAARAVALALANDRCERIDVLARSPQRVQELEHVIEASPTRIGAAPGDRKAAYDLAINCTPLGMHIDDELPLDAAMFERIECIMDLVYARGSTPLVRAARAAGLRAFDGTEMLLQQAAAAFERWWNQPAPLEVMRQALYESN